MRSLFLITVIAALLPLSANAQEYYFRVLLDDKPIGFHQYRIKPNEHLTEVTSEASYQVTWLFMTVYEYQHKSIEIWRQGCLQSIKSRTDDNGKNFEVTGTADTHKATITTNGKLTEIDKSCLRTFAYWNPKLLHTQALHSQELLNAQTGELEPVNIENQGAQPLPWDSGKTAQSYRLNVEDMSIDLWYTNEDHWLGLASTLENGRTLVYQPVNADNYLQLARQFQEPTP